MTDIAQAAKAEMTAAKAELAGTIAGAEAYVSTLAHGEFATLAPAVTAAETSLKVLFAHKLLVLCDVAMIAMAFVAGHYI